jgi:serine/threonine-protein kinase
LKLEIGELIDERYEVLSEIGAGGMSRVYLALDQRLNKTWAVKQVNMQGAVNNELVESGLATEINILRRLRNPHLPTIADVFEFEDSRVIIMDYVEGRSLGEFIEETGGQPQESVIDWAKQLCEVLDYMHNQPKPLIYRDMKPDNVMLDPAGNIVLIDFGTVREIVDPTKTHDTTSLGTRDYAAPEQMAGDKGQSDARTDLFALGSTIYHLITGRKPRSEPPFEMIPIREWDPNLSSGLEYIIQKCTMSKPEDRYQTAMELMYDLEHYEELDTDFVNAQKKSLIYFISALAAAIIFFAVGAICLYLNNYDIESIYREHYTNAQTSTNVAQALDSYVNAINTKPTSIDAYMGYVQTAMNDSNFTSDEYTVIQRLITENIDYIEKDPEYYTLLFTLGKAVWFYYDYGKESNSTNALTRMKAAYIWFNNISVKATPEKFAKYQQATYYMKIAKYYNEYNLRIEEADDVGMYANYWKDLTELTNSILSDGDQPELIKFETYRLIFSSLEQFAKRFKTDKVNVDDIKDRIHQTVNGVDGLEATSDKTIAIKQDIQARYEIVNRLMQNVFGPGEYIK